MRAAKLDFTAKLTELATQVAIQLENPTGATLEKNAARETLEAKAFKMCAAVRGYAAQSDMKDLYERVDYTKTDFYKFRDAELVGVVANLVQELTPLVADLAEYNVGMGDINALETANTAFGSLMKNPTASIARRKAATDKIAELMPPLMDFLVKRMDNVIVGIADVQPEFVDIYNNVRTINDSVSNPLSLTITTLDAETQEPVPNVQLEIVGEGINRVSSARGYNTVQNLAAGPHDVLATHPNFVTQTVRFSIVSGETTELVVLLVRA